MAVLQGVVVVEATQLVARSHACLVLLFFDYLVSSASVFVLPWYSEAAILLLPFMFLLFIHTMT